MSGRAVGRLAAVFAVACAVCALALATARRAWAQPAPGSRPVNSAAGRTNSAIDETGMDAADVGLLALAGSIDELEGAPVIAVMVESEDSRWKLPLGQRVIEPGQPLDPGTVRAALRALVEGGGVASAEAEAERHPDGVVLHLRVAPRRVAAAVKVRVEGDHFSSGSVAQAAGASEGMELTVPGLAAMRARVKLMCVRKGYAACEVQAETSDTDNPLAVVLTLSVVPGERREVSRRIFVVDAAHDAELGGLDHEYAVGAGDPADEDDLAEADQKLGERLQRAGFLRAAVSHALVTRVDAGVAHTFLFVYPNPGPRVRLIFDGQVQFSNDELKEALALKNATALDPGELVDRLRAFYRERGFYDVEVEHSVRGGPDDPENVVRFTIHEGGRVVVAERLFACLPPAHEPDGAATPSAELGLSPGALGDELDAVLEESLPRPSLLAGADPIVIHDVFGPGGAGGAARPLRLRPATTYTPEVYAKALDHLRDYVHSKGYLNAAVGPVSVVRARCDPKARGSSCVPLPLPERPLPACASDAVELPVPEKPLGNDFECRPDARHGVHCSPVLSLRIPVALGPRTVLYDVVFSGNEGKGYLADNPDNPQPELDARFTSKVLADIAALELGGPVSNAALEGARQRILEHYHNEGYPYASVATTVEASPDRSRARVRFEIHEYGPVEIIEYDVRGNVHTSRALILSRLELCQEPKSCTPHERIFRRDLVRASEEHIATLGVFSSVSIALEDPEIPLPKKRVIITVVEQGSQYTEPRIGFSSGEGIRGAFEYGHRNIAGQAISFTLRLQFSWLPPPLILDADFRSKYESLSLSEQLARRILVSMRFPDIGLGPDFSFSFDGIDVRDNERDFGITKDAAIPTLTWKPAQELNVQLSMPSVERNDVAAFGNTSTEIIQNAPGQAPLLVGVSLAVAERLSATWDRRDNAFDAKRGTLLSGSVEHVNAFPITNTDTDVQPSDFLRISGKLGGYIPLTDNGFTIAAIVSLGGNVQLRADSETYPDRLFYLGGIDSLRGFALNSLVAEDTAQLIVNSVVNPLTGKPFAIEDIVVRGGNLFVNPRLELRTPLSEVVGLGWFLDTGNVWTSASAIGRAEDFFTWRYAAGAGVRIATPLGPIVLDYGFNLVRRSWEDLGALHFAVGVF